MDSYVLKQVVDQIRKSSSFLFITSNKIDGDSLGSILALHSCLRKLGKTTTALSYSQVPPLYKFLPFLDIFDKNPDTLSDFIITLHNVNTEVDEVRYTTNDEGELSIIVTPKKGFYTPADMTVRGMTNSFDTIFAMDAGDKKNLGKMYQDHIRMFETTTIINIDHHVSNDNFGTLNLVDTKASSTSELVYYIIKFLDPNLIDEDIATCLLLGIIYDTHNFQNSNTTPECLNIASELVNLGGRQQEIIKSLYKTKSLNMLKLWGKILSKLQVDAEHRIIWSTISYNDFKSFNTSEEDAQGIIDELMSNAPQTDFIVLLRETEPKKISASIRTKSIDVDGVSIAQQFGGGGHTEACGFTLENSELKKVEQEVIAKIVAYQKERMKRKKGQEEKLDSGTYKAQILANFNGGEPSKPSNDSGNSEERLAKNLEKDLLG